MKQFFTLVFTLIIGSSALSQTYLSNKDFDDQSITSGGWQNYVVYDTSSGGHSWYTQNLGGPAADYYAAANGYGSSPDSTLLWLISPSFDLSTATSPEVFFDNALNYNGPALELAVSTDYDGSSNPMIQGTWDTITTSANWSGGGFTWVSTSADLSAYNGNSSVYVAFVYSSGGAGGAALWEVDSIEVTESAGPPSIVSIYDIQYATAPPYASAYDGQAVTTSGIVTAVDTGSLGFWIQDTMGAAWNGLYIYDPQGPDPTIGDSVEVTGTVVEFNELTEMGSVTNVNTVSSGNTVTPGVITTLNANDEMFESCFIRVEAATVTNPTAGFGQFEIDDSSGPVLVDDRMYDHFANLNDVYNVQGVMYYAFAERKILPRMPSDVEDITSVGEFAFDVRSIYPNPVNDVLTIELSSVPEGAVVQLIDATGKVISEMNLTQMRTEMDFTSVAAGLYSLTIRTESGVKSYKVVK